MGPQHGYWELLKKSRCAFPRNAVAMLIVVEENRANRAKPRIQVPVRWFRLLSHFLYFEAINRCIRRRWERNSH